MEENKKIAMISGKVSGNPTWRETFIKAEKKLEELNLEPLNPINSNVPTFDRALQMKTSLESLLKADYLILLDDWKDSEGSRLFYFIATQIGVTVAEFKDDQDNPLKPVAPGEFKLKK